MLLTSFASVSVAFRCCCGCCDDGSGRMLPLYDDWGENGVCKPLAETDAGDK